MAQRIFCWLTDEETLAYQDICEREGIEFTQLGTYLLCRALDLEDIPTKRKKRDKWLEDHELRTRLEFKDRGSGTELKVEAMMRAQPKRVWSTKDILAGLGWKGSGSLVDMLRSSDKFSQVPPPKDYQRQRGGLPKFWVLSDRRTN